ncbi:ArgE/DapE family deacylase [Devosia sp. A369]
MLDDQAILVICDAVDRNFDEQIALTGELVACPSLRGHEAAAQDVMASAMAAAGLVVDRFLLDAQALTQHPGHSPIAISYDGMTNVVGSWRPAQETGRSLIFNGHVDVVPPGNPERWTTAPFGPMVRDGWMHGRGAGDMKAGLVGTLFSYKAIRAAGFQPNGRIHFQSVVEEEATGNGTLACLLRGYRADCMFVPEPFGPSLTRAQIGPIWFRIDLDASPEHASGFQTRSNNVIEGALRLWEAVKSLETSWNERARQDPFFGEHPLPLRFNLGKISGGEWPSSGPARCTLEARCAILPGRSRDAAASEIREFVQSASATIPELHGATVAVDFHGFYAEGYVLEGAPDQEAALAHAHHSVFGTALTEHITPAATDARFYGLYDGTPSLVYGPICDSAHGHDERVDLESVRQVTKTMALFIANWCGLSPAQN